MPTFIFYLTIFMFVLGILMIIRYLYQRFYLSKFVIKNLKDANTILELLINRLNALSELGSEQAKFSGDLTKVLERMDARIKELEKEKENVC